MSRKHTIATKDGQVEVPFTAEEEAARDAEEQAVADAQPSQDAQAEIAKLEAEISPRRVREAVLTAEGKTWLEDQEALIAIERAKL